VAQIALAAGSIIIDTRGAGAVTVHLQPAELGAVSIRVAKTMSGTASVDVAVERGATLQTLQSDLTHLHQALDRAGVAENRSITLHLASTADLGTGQAGTRSQGGDAGGLAGQGNPGQDAGSMASGQGGNSPGGQQGHARTQAAPTPLPHTIETTAAARPELQPRAGINITA
jgi:flagellar hook-length control protein FliK